MVMFHGYKLYRTSPNWYGYVSDDLIITLYNGSVKIIKDGVMYNATVNTDYKLVEDVLTGEFFDKILSNNPAIPPRPVSPRIFEYDKEFPFDYFGQSPEMSSKIHYIQVDLISDPMTIKTQLLTKKMYVGLMKFTIDDDFRLYTGPGRGYKTTIIPTLNAIARVKEKYYIEDFLDKLTNELKSKNTKEIGFTEKEYKMIDPQFTIIPNLYAKEISLVFADEERGERIVTARAEMRPRYVFRVGKHVLYTENDKKEFIKHLPPRLQLGWGAILL